MPEYRDVGGHEGLGDRRYERYCAAFDRIEHCVTAGYFLEAIALLDSLIWDRISSRLGYLKGKQIEINKNAGTICSELIGSSGEGGVEQDPEFRDVIRNIKEWLVRRNDAVHATAKVFRTDTSEEDFSIILKSHKQTAIDGVNYLQAFDLLDTKSREKVGKVPASFPNAFFPKSRTGRSQFLTWGRTLGEIQTDTAASTR
jgi:hypothetical protein